MKQFLMIQFRNWKMSCIGFWMSLFFVLPIPSYALDEIIHPFLSVRSMGMGGAIMTSGLYEENFFYNPARMTANPYSKFTLLQLTPVDTTKATIDQISNITKSGGNTVGAVANTAGNNLHEQFQLVLPAYYLAATEERKWSLALGLILNSQVNADIRQSYQMNVQGIGSIGPALTFAHKFLDDALSVGVTGHLTYRVATNPSYSLANYFQGVPLTLSGIAGQGTMIDFDVGATYKIIKLAGFQFSAAAALQNALGGNFKYNFINVSNTIQSQPSAQPRSGGLGGSVEHDGWGPLGHSILAVEVYDIGNNTNGSFFRMMHLGFETHFISILALRAGMNQGYWTAGAGLDLHFLDINVASYGVEMGLTPGTLEDRRYTLNVGLHI